MPSMVRSIDMKLCGSVQGAAEIVIAKCDSFLDANGQRAALTEEKRTEILGIITQMAQEGLRTLCLSFRDFDSSADAESPVFDLPPEENLTACCIVGIKVRSKPCTAPLPQSLKFACLLCWRTVAVTCPSVPTCFQFPSPVLEFQDSDQDMKST